jgi:urease accessory protein
VNVRLLQLASPALPVGAYSYSQGLESAVEAGLVADAASARRWIGDVLEHSVARMEAPVFLRLARAWALGDDEGAWRWNAEFVATRETAELRAETLQMGHSLARLARELGVRSTERLARDELAYPAAFAFVSTDWGIDAREALEAYLYAWVENQVLAAVKCVPLGQSEGQRAILDLAARIPGVVEAAEAMGDEALGSFAPALAIHSTRHESQYTRIFRS